MTRRADSPLVAALGLLALIQSPAGATPVDFSTFVVETYPATSGFAVPNWVVHGNGKGLTEITNAHPTIAYGQESILNKHISGIITPGGDDDPFGLVLGFNPGDTTASSANFLLIDWKGVSQNFDFTGGIHDLTVGALPAPAGLALSRVTGAPNADELWAHQDLAGNPTGGVTELARANTLGASNHRTIRSHKFDILYQADRVQVFVDGVLQFDQTGTFGDGRLGAYELSQSPGASFYDFDIRDIGQVDPVNPHQQPYTAGYIQVTPGSTNDQSSFWNVIATGVGAHQLTVPTNFNFADFEVAAGGSVPATAEGITLVTVAKNGGNNGQFATAQGAFNHTGWGNNRQGIATHGVRADRGEHNIDVAVAFFPFAQGWIGGQVSAPSATTVALVNGVGNVTQITTPSTVDQDGVYNVVIPGVNSATDGLFFVVSATNEGNYAAATRNGNGGWRVGVRDNFLANNTTADNFEHDAFNYLFMPLNTPGLIGAHVTGFDAFGNAITDLVAGDFSLVKQGTGQYLLTIGGNSATTGMLLLTGSSPHTLANGELAPLNHYLTYESLGGNEFLINLLQIQGGVGASLADGSFFFAYLRFDTTVPEPATGLLALGSIAALALRRRRHA